MNPITIRDKKGRIVKGSGTTHGLSETPAYHAWEAMKARCLNKNHPMYRLYGARGIQVCEKWLDFTAFFNDMGHPNRMTLERINNDLGYSKENCRWATIQEQQKNKSTNNESVGIVYDESRKRWRADICYHGKRYFLGRFKTKIEAANKREAAEKNLWYGDKV